MQDRKRKREQDYLYLKLKFEQNQQVKLTVLTTLNMDIFQHWPIQIPFLVNILSQVWINFFKYSYHISRNKANTPGQHPLNTFECDSYNLHICSLVLEKVSFDNLERSEHAELRSVDRGLTEAYFPVIIYKGGR